MISLLLGLGNIGRKYVGTRHNLGFELLDRLATKLGVGERHRTELLEWAEANICPSIPLGMKESVDSNNPTASCGARKPELKPELKPEHLLNPEHEIKPESGLKPGLDLMTESESVYLNLQGRRLILAWPRTYMNCSGDAAVKVLIDNNIEPVDMLVLVDDFALPLGGIRFRAGGSDGGHNGLASIIESVGTDKFPRLRMGIGPVDKSMDIVDHVLSKFTAVERKSADAMLDRAAQAVFFAIDHRLEEAMSKYNHNPAPPESA